MKRIIIVMALLGIVASAVLTGCGNDTASTSTPPASNATNAPAKK